MSGKRREEERRMRKERGEQGEKEKEEEGRKRKEEKKGDIYKQEGKKREK